jgi:hypothetical protein
MVGSRELASLSKERCLNVTSRTPPEKAYAYLHSSYSMYVCMYVRTHVCMYVYILLYVRPKQCCASACKQWKASHFYIHTRIHTCIHTYMQAHNVMHFAHYEKPLTSTCIYACIHTYMQAHNVMHFAHYEKPLTTTYIHEYIHAYIHTCKRTMLCILHTIKSQSLKPKKQDNYIDTIPYTHTYTHAYIHTHLYPVPKIAFCHTIFEPVYAHVCYQCLRRIQARSVLLSGKKISSWCKPCLLRYICLVCMHMHAYMSVSLSFYLYMYTSTHMAVKQPLDMYVNANTHRNAL